MTSLSRAAPVIVDNVDRDRYELHLDGEVAGYLTYHRSDGHLSIASTVTLPSHRGQGLAARLVEHVIGDARRSGLSVTTGCWYVQDWLAVHAD
jgi:predicted GNAT family acetyltransferase